MAKILVVYGTRYGQTRKIADALADEMRAAGHYADVMGADLMPPEIRPEVYDAIIAGGPVYSSHYPRPLRNWVRSHSSVLSEKPGAFFSVCLGVLQTNDSKAQADEKRIVETFFESTGWRPEISTIFAGGLPYTRYGWITRWVMKNIVKRAGGDVDTSRDYEYTNWEDVRQFARLVLRQVELQRPRKISGIA